MADVCVLAMAFCHYYAARHLPLSDEMSAVLYYGIQA